MDTSYVKFCCNCILTCFETKNEGDSPPLSETLVVLPDIELFALQCGGGSCVVLAIQR